MSPKQIVVVLLPSELWLNPHEYLPSPRHCSFEERSSLWASDYPPRCTWLCTQQATSPRLDDVAHNSFLPACMFVSSCSRAHVQIHSWESSRLRTLIYCDWLAENRFDCRYLRKRAASLTRASGYLTLGRKCCRLDCWCPCSFCPLGERRNILANQLHFLCPYLTRLWIFRQRICCKQSVGVRRMLNLFVQVVPSSPKNPNSVSREQLISSLANGEKRARRTCS